MLRSLLKRGLVTARRVSTWTSSLSAVRGTTRWLNTPYASGRYRGHPRWHLLSPRFHQWRWANPWQEPNERVSQHWRTMPAVQKDFGRLLRKYSSSLALSPVYEPMARYISERSLYPILDIGCGDGVFLRYLHESHGAPLDALWGLDLDPKRVVAARRQMYIGAVNGIVKREWAGADVASEDDAGILAGITTHVFTYDMMGDTSWPEAVRSAGIRAVTMIGVAPTLNDSELAQMAGRIAELNPEFILNSDLFANIKENYGGRLGLEPFFERHGYRPVGGEWVGERFGLQYLPYFLLQRPYWRSSFNSVLRRSDGRP